jgi:tripartite-type tricarboxylate transporter receptor subunit TctC
MKTKIAGFGIAIILMLGADHSEAQNFPVKPLRIVTAETGGGNDFAARLIAHGLTSNLGQQVIVENRGGASGTIAAQAVARATPDGYTLLLYSGSLWIFPLMTSKAPWNAFTDFAPLTLAASSPSVLVVAPAFPVKTVQDLIALAKARPGGLNYASGSTGASTHLAAELFKAMAGVNIVRIAYKGNAAGYNDIIGGSIQMLFGTAAGAMPFLKSGRLRALAVTSAQPSALFPGLPTIASAGLKGYESVSMYGMFAPAKTPTAITRRLNQEIVRVIRSESVKDTFLTAGVEGVGSTPDELTAAMKGEVARLGKVIRDEGIRAD